MTNNWNEIYIERYYNKTHPFKLNEKVTPEMLGRLCIQQQWYRYIDCMVESIGYAYGGVYFKIVVNKDEVFNQDTLMDKRLKAKEYIDTLYKHKSPMSKPMIF